MIAKITHGRSATDALTYDYGPGRANEHHNPRRVAGNIPGKEWRTRAQHMQKFVDAHQQGNDQGIYRIALANPESDRILTDQKWEEVINKFITLFGADKGMWEAARHDDHHVHLTIVKFGYDGMRMPESHDYARVAGICRRLEIENNLTNAAQTRHHTFDHNNTQPQPQPQPATQHTHQKSDPNNIPDRNDISARRKHAYKKALLREAVRQQDRNQPEPTPPT
jgi:hypothetical protein